MSVTLLNSSNQILASLLRGDYQLRPNILYVEFQQGITPVTSLPTVDPADNEYFLNLREDVYSDRDFLRIPVVSVTPVVGGTPNDITLFFNGICTGTSGVGGKFTEGSTVYGISLVASPTYDTAIDDLTRDVVWARGYYAPSHQIKFSTASQLAVTFKINLTV